MGFFDFMSDKPSTPDYSGVIAGLNTAAQTSADRGVFKPVTISTSFGTPTYGYDAQGRLTSAGYQAAPWLQNLQTGAQNLAGQYQNVQANALGLTQPLDFANQAYGAGQNVYGYAGQAAGQAPGLYGIGQELYGMGRGLMPAAQGFSATGQALQGTGADLYAKAASALPTSYDTAAKTQEYYDRMQQMVAPEREQQLAQTRNNVFQKGRQGLAVGATQAGGMAATNPEMAAYYNAIAKQDLGLANQAEQQTLANLAQQTNMGTQLYGAGLGQYGAGLNYGQAGVGTTQAAGGLLGQGINATQAGTGALQAAAGLYGQGTGLFGQGADLQNAYYRNLTASQVPGTTNLQNLGTMEAMAQQPLELGLRFGSPTTQGMQYGGNMLWDAANAAARLQTGQINAETQAANTPTGWQALAGGAINSLANAGINWATGGMGGMFSGANSAALGNLTSSGANLAGGINTGGFNSGYNPMQGFYRNPYSTFGQ